MKLTTFLRFTLALAAFCTWTHAQDRFRIAEIYPYDKAVPGQIMTMQVEGLNDGSEIVMLDDKDFKLLVSQDGATQEAKIRAIHQMRTSRPRADNGANGNVEPGEMRLYESINFVVPGGVHPGEVELLLSYKGHSGKPISLRIVDKPLPPTIGVMSLIGMGSNFGSTSGTKNSNNDQGLRLERGSTSELLVSPLVDPDDPNSAVLIRFKQGDSSFDASTRVRHESFKVLESANRFATSPARDFLEVNVPTALTTGPADMEIRLRANGREGEPARLKVTITDATRAAVAPAENAPRILMIAPQRLGAGQAVMLALDYQRTLDPDISQTMFMVEQGSSRYIVRPEYSTLVGGRSERQDAPVTFWVRTTKEIIGKAQIRVFNTLRGQNGGMSEPASIEILDEPLPPELFGVTESTDGELAPLRQMYEIQTRAGRKFQEYDPQWRFLTLRARGVDYNPRGFRITIEQNGKSFVLTPADILLTIMDKIIVRMPTGLTKGSALLSIENRGVDGYSKLVSEKFEVH